MSRIESENSLTDPQPGSPVQYRQSTQTHGPRERGAGPPNPEGQAMSLPDWILNASRKQDVTGDCQREEISRISLVGCLKIQSRDPKWIGRTWSMSPRIEKLRQAACNGCKYKLNKYQVHVLRRMLREGWEFEGKTRWRPRSGYAPSANGGNGEDPAMIHRCAIAAAEEYLKRIENKPF